VTSAAIADRVAIHFQSRFLRGYTRWKVRTDPVYAAVADHLRATSLPVTDLGCGVGVLALYLRECGVSVAIRGIDHDSAKVEAARQAASGIAGLEFVTGDARQPLAPVGNVVLLDVLHYFRDADQSTILRNIAGAVSPGGMVVLRDGIRDGTLRYRMTYAAEMMATGSGWLKADMLNFPTMELVMTAFPSFHATAVPMWGSTPFNNYLFVFKRPASGTTKA
jgi:2-polyprenyl-3-methyl-5-hydroxy-6-metoxy-1,4-benzoquinol methylase